MGNELRGESSCLSLQSSKNLALATLKVREAEIFIQRRGSIIAQAQDDQEPMPWDMSSFNVSATLNIFKVFARPSLCLPQATISSFNELPIPLNKAFAKYSKNGEEVNIKAVILDKDDCFAVPHENEVYKPYKVSLVIFLQRHFRSCRFRSLSYHHVEVCFPWNITMCLVYSSHRHFWIQP